MKLSIVTVCYNVENCIEKTILSVLNQTSPVYEYIIVDGGSKDETMMKVIAYSDAFKEKGIRYLYHSEKDEGISDAFNKGIRQATGDLIGLINADDELMPEAASVLAKNFERQPAEVYYGNCIWVEPQNKLSFISKPKEQNPNKLSRLLYEMVMIHPATFVKPEAYRKAGLFDTSFRYCMDQELLYRMVRNDIRFCYIDKALTKFKAGGVSDSNARKVFDEANRIAIMYGEPKIKVRLIETKKLIRNKCARIAKKAGFYKVLKKQM